MSKFKVGDEVYRVGLSGTVYHQVPSLITIVLDTPDPYKYKLTGEFWYCDEELILKAVYDSPLYQALL